MPYCDRVIILSRKLVSKYEQRKVSMGRSSSASERQKYEYLNASAKNRVSADHTLGAIATRSYGFASPSLSVIGGLCGRVVDSEERGRVFVSTRCDSSSHACESMRIRFNNSVGFHCFVSTFVKYKMLPGQIYYQYFSKAAPRASSLDLYCVPVM